MARFEPKSPRFLFTYVNKSDSLALGNKYRSIQMADKNKFEEMLERLINEDKTGAEELFHEIVVEKSRSIYENLLAEEYDEEEDEDVEEGSYKDKEDDDDEDMEEGFDLEDFEVSEEGEDEDPMAAMGGDETDDLEMDVDMDSGEEGEMSMDGEEDEELEDRVVDLEDALDDLKAEFEQMMSDEDSGEESEEGEDDAEMDMDDEGEDDAEMDMDDEGEEEKEESYVDPTDQVATMREYVEKVTAKMGDDGANTQSTVAGPNDMGGTAENIAQDDVENGVEANQGNLKGNALSDQNPKDMNTGNVNVPGGKAGKSMKNMPKGHGAEKKGSGESGADAHSTLGSKK
jgi:hypothetical protein